MEIKINKEEEISYIFEILKLDGGYCNSNVNDFIEAYRRNSFMLFYMGYYEYDKEIYYSIGGRKPKILTIEEFNSKFKDIIRDIKIDKILK